MASTRIDLGGKNPGYIEQGKPIQRKLAVPAGVVTGDVVLIGEMIVYVQESRDSDGNAQCLIPGYYAQTVEVYGRSDGAGSAVAVGDRLYADGADGQLNKDSTNGEPFGFALGAVGSGSNADILVAFGQ